MATAVICVNICGPSKNMQLLKTFTLLWFNRICACQYSELECQLKHVCFDSFMDLFAILYSIKTHYVFYETKKR